MAAKKETKAQRIAREKREAKKKGYLDIKKLEKAISEYMPRLVRALERATEKRWCISFVNGFVIVESDIEEFTFYSLPEIKSTNYLDDHALLHLEFELDEDDKKIEAAKIKEHLRQSALAKLTEEERKALGYI